MTQFNIPIVDPSVDTGITLSTYLNGWAPAVLSNHRGSVRPSYAVPGLIWSDSDTNSPYYFNGATDFRLLTEGDTSSFLPVTGGTLTGPLTGTTIAAGQFRTSSGTAVDPGYTFTADPDTGMFFAGGGRMGFSTDAVERFSFGAGGANFSVGVWAPSFNVQSSGAAAIEIGGAISAYLDLKTPNSDDYDIRLITNGSGGALMSMAALEISALGQITYSANGNGHVFNDPIVANNSLSITGVVSSVGKSTNGSTGEEYTTLIQSTNVWGLMYLQAYHQPGIKASLRMVVGTSVVELTSGGTFNAPTVSTDWVTARGATIGEGASVGTDLSVGNRVTSPYATHRDGITYRDARILFRWDGSAGVLYYIVDDVLEAPIAVRAMAADQPSVGDLMQKIEALTLRINELERNRT